MLLSACVLLRSLALAAIEVTASFQPAFGFKQISTHLMLCNLSYACKRFRKHKSNGKFIKTNKVVHFGFKANKEMVIYNQKSKFQKFTKIAFLRFFWGISFSVFWVFLMVSYLKYEILERSLTSDN